MNRTLGVESPVDRAAQSAMNAIEDLNTAMHAAETLEQMTIVRKHMEAVLRSLVISLAVAETLEMYL